MTENLHDTIIRALAVELRPHLPRCTLHVCEVLRGTSEIRVDGFGEGNGNICRLHATENGIRVLGAHDDELRYTVVEYCNPAMVDILVRCVESELVAFGAVKAAVRARFNSSLTSGGHDG